MKASPKSSLLIVAVGVALIGAWIGYRKSQRESETETVRSPLDQMFKTGPLPGFVLSETDRRRDSTVYTLTNKDSVAKIEVLEHIEARDAETLVQDGVMGIQALYANALSPYPGDISNKVTTEPAFQPRLFRITNSAITYTCLLLYANDRFGYGATAKDLVKYKSLMGWFYCAPRQEFFKVKFFAPLNVSDHEMEAQFTSLRCR